MKTLAIDSSHDSCSAACLDGEKVVFEIVEQMQYGQAERLIPMTCEVLKNACFDFKELDLIAVTTGPGSFTGVRVGLSAACGMALASGCKMVGVSVFEALAFKIFRNDTLSKRMCLVLETRRDDFYVQCFQGKEALEAPSAMTAEEIKKFARDYMFAGNAVERLSREIGKINICPVCMPTASDVGLISLLKKTQQGYPAPLYLHQPDVTVCRK